jgi:hypothetical protein
VGPHGQEQGQPAPGAQPPAASETQATPGAQAPSPEQTRTQILGAMLERANADIQKATDKGDTARVEELTKAKQIYEEKLAKQQEEPIQETSTKEQSLQDRINRELETAKNSKERAAELTDILNATKRDFNQKDKKDGVSLPEIEQDLQNRIARELSTAANSTARAEELANIRDVSTKPITQSAEQVQEQPLVEQPPVEQAPAEQSPIEQPPQKTPPSSEAQTTSPNDTIQLKQGETVVLSPDGQTRIVPTAEEVANLNRLMGERPDKNAPPVEPTQSTQPTEVQDGQAQAQAEALLGQTQPAELWDKADLATRAQWIKDTGASTDFATRKAAEWTTWDKVPPDTFQQRLPKVINPQEGGNTKYSMPLVQPVDMATDATMEEFEAVRRQFQEKQKQETPFKKWFGQGTPGVTADEKGTPITLYHGTNNPEFNQWDSSRAGENSNHPTSGLGFL